MHYVERDLGGEDFFQLVSEFGFGADGDGLIQVANSEWVEADAMGSLKEFELVAQGRSHDTERVHEKVAGGLGGDFTGSQLLRLLAEQGGLLFQDGDGRRVSRLESKRVKKSK